jgi:hypothetical protein
MEPSHALAPERPKDQRHFYKYIKQGLLWSYVFGTITVFDTIPVENNKLGKDELDHLTATANRVCTAIRSFVAYTNITKFVFPLTRFQTGKKLYLRSRIWGVSGSAEFVEDRSTRVVRLFIDESLWWFEKKVSHPCRSSVLQESSLYVLTAAATHE